MNNASLRPLVSLNWPPEPDPGLFTDPLLKDDPKPLRHEELLRIGMSSSFGTCTNLVLNHVQPNQPLSVLF